MTLTKVNELLPREAESMQTFSGPTLPQFDPNRKADFYTSIDDLRNLTPEQQDSFAGQKAGIRVFEESRAPLLERLDPSIAAPFQGDPSTIPHTVTIYPTNSQLTKIADNNRAERQKEAQPENSPGTPESPASPSSPTSTTNKVTLSEEDRKQLQDVIKAYKQKIFGKFRGENSNSSESEVFRKLKEDQKLSQILYGRESGKQDGDSGLYDMMGNGELSPEDLVNRLSTLDTNSSLTQQIAYLKNSIDELSKFRATFDKKD
jgi:hypothetical protein